MATIKELLEMYFAATVAVSGQLDDVERQEDKHKGTLIPMPEIRVPNYAEEVIRPILRMLDEAMPEYRIQIPPCGECRPVCGAFHIRADRTCLGGLSLPTSKDHNLYFAPVKHKRFGKRQRIETFEQLQKLVRIELNKRGLLILPKHLP